MSRKIKLGLRELDVSTKIKIARSIIFRMENNCNFPEPDPSLQEVEDTAVRLEAKYNEVQKLRACIQKQTAELNKIETELDKRLTLLASYVESKAKGNAEIIQSAGMKLRADSVPIGIPAQASIKALRETINSGELKMIWERVRGAKVYNIEIAENNQNESVWKLFDSTTKTKAVINNLKIGTKYWFRVQAVGSAGKGPYSEPVMKYAT